MLTAASSGFRGIDLTELVIDGGLHGEDGRLREGGNTIEYEDKSVFEGNREFEEVVCPVCGNELCQVFTDLLPNPRVVKKHEGR